MDKVVVDPNLFITCRLCLEDMGAYQIVPTVQQKIKFCFDIEVAPYDGLPQLICKSCESILSDYYKRKVSFIEKQESLKYKLGVTNETQPQPQDAKEVAVKQTFSPESLKSRNVEDNNVKLRKRKGSTVSSSNNSLLGIDHVSDTSKKSRKEFQKGEPKYSKYDYSKQFACKFCFVTYCKKNRLLQHSATFHSNLKKKFPDVFKKFCTVQLNRIDERPNFVKLNKVQYSQDKFIQHEDDINYYIKYISRDQNKDIHTESSESETDELFIKRGKRKLRRLLSRSSSDTVVIPDKHSNDSLISSDFEEEKAKINDINISSFGEGECINIDSDSTDSSSEVSKFIEENRVGEKYIDDDYKTIQNIIEVCRNKYIKRIAETNKKADFKSQLKHKFLSVGHKILNKQGFNFPGLLRFLEHENVEIIWMPFNPTKAVGNKSFVRISTKVKEPTKDHDKDFVFVSEEMSDNALELPTTKTFKQTIKLNNILPDPSLELPPTNTLKQTKNILMLSQEAVVAPVQVEGQAVLYSSRIDKEGNSSSNKILNANPVANPKQLPRKTIQTEIKTNSLNTDDRNENKDDAILIEIDDELSDSNFCMPVITSTTSLAFHAENQKSDTEVNNTVSSTLNDLLQDPSSTSNSMNNEMSTSAAPRIKVKPASELMAINPMQTNITQYNASGKLRPETWHINQSQYYPTNNVSSYLYNVPLQNSNTSNPMPVLVTNDNNIQAVNNQTGEGLQKSNDLLILDSVDMPNTKTDSPFKYLKKVLQIYNILLLDSKDAVDYSKHFSCLIKFKVLFKQENVKPVTLCLSLHCLENIFYIDIKNGDRLHIDMIKISANWQWEIIKIYQGDVVNKILNNSQKISTEMYETAKKFLCIIKSITLKKNLS